MAFWRSVVTNVLIMTPCDLFASVRIPFSKCFLARTRHKRADLIAGEKGHLA
jgi:hypothetical protein